MKNKLIYWGFCTNFFLILMMDAIRKMDLVLIKEAKTKAVLAAKEIYEFGGFGKEDEF